MGERGSGTFEVTYGEELKREVDGISLWALPVSEVSFSSYVGCKKLQYMDAKREL